MDEQELRQSLISALEQMNHQLRYMYQAQGLFLAMYQVLEEYLPGFQEKVKAHKFAPVDLTLTYSTEKQPDTLGEIIQRMKA